MRYGAMDYLVAGADERDMFDRAARLGFDGVEVGLARADLRAAGAPRLGRLRAAAAAAGLAIPSLVLGEHNGGGLASDDAAAAAAAAEDIRQAIGWAAELGAPVVLVPFFFEGDIVGDAAFGRAAAAFRELCGLAAGRGVTLCYEGTLPAERIRALAQAIGSPAFGCYFDLANVVWLGMDTPTEIRGLGALIRQVHMKESLVGPGDVRPGAGRVNYAGSAAALREVGYSGWVVLETPGGPPEQVAEDLAFTRRVFEGGAMSIDLSPAVRYMEAARAIVERVHATQLEAIGRAAEICASSIAAGGLVHLFGTGHSRIPVEEIFPRHGSFPGFHPIVELSLTNHTQVVGANGQRQAMYLEKIEGFGEIILRNFIFGPHDSMIVFSNGGVNGVVIDVALGAKARGMPLIAVVSLEHCNASGIKHSSGKRLPDIADVTIDNCSPVGDAMVSVEGLDYPVGPGSSVGYVAVVNALKCLVAAELTRRGQPPLVLTSGALIGAQASAELFDATYDDYRARVAPLYGGRK